MNLPLDSFKIRKEGVSRAHSCLDGVVERVDARHGQVRCAEEYDAEVVEEGDCRCAVDGELDGDGVEDKEGGCCCRGGEVLRTEGVEEDEEEEGGELEERSHDDLGFDGVCCRVAGVVV